MKRALSLLMVLLLLLCGCSTEEGSLAGEKTGAGSSKKETFTVEKVLGSESKEPLCLTAGDLGAHFDYEIYYVGIEAFYLNVDGKSVELQDALAQDPGILDWLYTLWNKDHGNRYAYDDGESVKYPYEQYVALKCNSVCIAPKKTVIVKDLIIGKDDASVNQLWKELKETAERSVIPSNKKTVTYADADVCQRLTSEELRNDLGYDIYYCGIDEFYVELNGKTEEFRTLLKQDTAFLDQLYTQWDKECDGGAKAYDGGSTLYDYGEYRIFKLNTLSGRKDLIITSPSISLDHAKEATN